MLFRSSADESSQDHTDRLHFNFGLEMRKLRQFVAINRSRKVMSSLTDKKPLGRVDLNYREAFIYCVFSDLGDFDLDFSAELCRSVDTVNYSLIIEDL